MSEETTVYQVGNDEESNTPEFAAHHVKVMAEGLWYGMKKATLFKRLNLTEEHFEEIRLTCEYKVRVFNLMFENRSAKEFEAWVGNHGPNMPQNFGKIVGIDPEDVPDMVEQVRQAHVDIAAGKGRKPWRLQT